MPNQKNWRQWLAKIPAPAFLLTILLCIAFQENFPFSDFPMYGRISNNTSYVYLTDSQDKPIPVEELTSIRTGKLKKIYSSKLKQVRKELEDSGVEIQGFQFMTVEQRRPAGEYTLKWLYENCRETARPQLYAHRPLRFHVVEVKVGPDRKMQHKHFLVAEVP